MNDNLALALLDIFTLQFGLGDVLLPALEHGGTEWKQSVLPSIRFLACISPYRRSNTLTQRFEDRRQYWKTRKYNSI